jgi:hypothetical protein
MLRALYRRLPKAGKACFKGAWLWLRQIAWQIPYAISYLCARLYRKRLASDALDVLFVMDWNDKDWILGAICRRIADASGRRVGYYCHKHFYFSGENADVYPLSGTGGAAANHASNSNGILDSFRDPLWPLSPKLPDAKNYFFADAPFFAWCLKSFPPLWHRKTFAYSTHPRERFSDREMVFVLNQATHTISMSSAEPLQKTSHVRSFVLLIVPRVKAGQAVTFAGTGSDADGSVQRYSWFFPEGTPESSLTPNAGQLVFPNVGTYTISLTTVDNKGINDPSPPTRTVTVHP